MSGQLPKSERRGGTPGLRKGKPISASTGISGGERKHFASFGFNSGFIQRTGRIMARKTVRLCFRGFAGRVVQFEEKAEIAVDQLETVLPSLAEKHAAALAAKTLHMIEIEFLDEPDPDQRFFRFGTDPAGMVKPMKVSFEDMLLKGKRHGS
jgi:hypothetical protein